MGDNDKKLHHNPNVAIKALSIGFLRSHYGLLMIKSAVIAFIELINEKIKAV